MTDFLFTRLAGAQVVLLTALVLVGLRLPAAEAPKREDINARFRNNPDVSQSVKNFEVDSILKGRVVSITNNDVIVDIGKVENLTTKDAGLNYTGLAVIEAAEDATPGEVEVAATITPAKGTPTTATLKFRVADKGD